MKNYEDEEYLDEQFPKGETKFRGQAMVLLALARQVGEEQAKEEFKENIEDWFDSSLNNLQFDEAQEIKQELLKELEEVKYDKR